MTKPNGQAISTHPTRRTVLTLAAALVALTVCSRNGNGLRHLPQPVPFCPAGSRSASVAQA